MEKEAKREKVHHVFQKIYKRYDAMNSLISFNQHKAWRRKADELVAARPGDRIIDVCCGTGDWTMSLAEKVGATGRVVGLDFSDNMLKIAKMKQDANQFEHVQLVNGDAMDLPYEDASFDRATIGFGLRNVPDYLTVLKEINRVLRPGGTLVCLETSQTKIPVYRQLYFIYFRFMMPMLGKLFAGSYKEYAWLNESASKFPDQKTLSKLFEQAGFANISVHSLMGGIAAIHRGIKA
ncbi:demethylmenaquinone methyltransferase [Sporolactobacillus terrae]|uniref:Demethylmenaquinone methyltransferase n=1 Tax=Sporolactobacillus terrae TaxID=269673 RepID=A0ABX5Q7L6_9BACL|nr:demethylmenaquinone methyltransferase [Sporolactobacillus terrae]QAA22617.1 bifunctional demethylmenaquinone methyltransferase/2-methoxy-6-polyprenyl-1,4-benzoquinol methylase [Sporolactobacillus terrae]QAA25591.1 bifunctional demethylmenaquinone methyltransferase/2-methoxy-6-polyprenyl-1,4-benzoquinol methylase [Sporolactobacillus terrae]UAK17398.1 demethylmenaquinone methyltransferase [Sporolactobacillus terrae]